MKSLLCLGMGYCALELSRRLAAQGWTVTGTTRDAEKAEDLERDGIRAAMFNGDAPFPGIVDLLSGVTHIVASIPPDDSGDLFLRHHADDLAKVARKIEWAGYLSTTGVYGDHAGDWVDEDTPPAPENERGQRRVTAEQQWLELGARCSFPVHVFRIAGIYGPGGRNPIDSVREGKARRIVKKNQFVGRVHRDDIAGILESSIASPTPGRIYNVVDNEPSAPADVIAYTAELLGVEAPPVIPFEEADLSAVARNFLSGSKRVSNRRVREELGYRFRYPTYREGIKALVSDPQ